MRPLRITDATTMILRLQKEIRRSEESRYDRRLHGVLLVAQGMSCPKVGRLLGDAPRTVEYWVQRFEARGLAGLTEGQRSGRPRRLSEAQVKEVDRALRLSPRDCGLPGRLWNGQTFGAWIARRIHVRLGVRQCQRLLRQRGFRMRKSRPRIAHGDAELQQAHKKTQATGRRSSP